MILAKARRERQKQQRPTNLVTLLACALLACGTSAWAGDRLIGTGGVTQVEGAAGGGLTTWALIAGTETQDHFGATANYTQVRTKGGFTLKSGGIGVGIYNRVELSASTLKFGLSDTVPGQSIRVDTFGLKVRVIGDAVYDQDTWLPQIAVGAMYKHNRDFDFIPKALGAHSASSTDLYIAATKVWLGGFFGRNLLADLTLRSTEANQFGILGFGGPQGGRRLRPEASVAVFINDQIAAGVDYRAKPDNLAAFKEQAASDVFVAWFPLKNLSLTAAWVNLGNIANKPSQTGWYLSGQLSF